MTKRSWSRFLGRLGAVLVATAQGILHEAGVLSAFAVARLGGSLIVVTGVVMLIRAVIHVRVGYWRPEARGPEWTLRTSRWLSTLLVLEFVIGLSMIGIGVVLVAAPSNLTALVATISFVIAVMVASDRTVVLAGKLNLPRASDVIVACGAVKSVRSFAKRWENIPGFHLLDEVWETTTKVGKVSGLVMVLVVVLVAVAAAQTTSLVPDVDKLLTPPPSAHRSEGGKAEKKKSTAGHKKTRPSGGGSTTPAKPAPPPHKETYDELCGRTIVPGEGAGAPASESLRTIWESYGGVVAGCAERAHELGTSSTYYIVGQCGGKFRSVALAGPSQAPVMLLQQPAQLAHRLLLEGVLIGASARTPIGPDNSGDYEVVDTSEGSYVAIREEETDGNGGPVREPVTCAELSPSVEQYVIVKPGMAKLWVEFERLTGEAVWPAFNTSKRERGVTLFSFYSSDDQRNTVASGTCLKPTECELVSGNLRLRNEPHEAEVETPEEISRLGPS